MFVANPIYDVVFKYLMDDLKVARFIISRILGSEVIDLQPRPQEVVGHLAQKSLTVYRLDYSARIKLEDGSEKIVIIEIQKAKYQSDILRFRKYLGEKYASDTSTILLGQDAAGRDLREAMPIVSIYFLGHRLENLTNPVIAVGRAYRDAITGEPLAAKDPFVECLTHDSFVIQIPYLTQRRRNDLETLLSIFDQANRSQDNHILNLQPDAFPQKFQSVIRRLQMAHSEPEVVTVMRLEDDVLEELQENERAIERQTQRIAEQARLSEELQKKNEAMLRESEAAERALEALKRESEAAKQEFEAAKQESEAAKQESEAAKHTLAQRNSEIRAQLARSFTALLATGMSPDAIAEVLGVSQDEVETPEP